LWWKNPFHTIAAALAAIPAAATGPRFFEDGRVAKLARNPRISYPNQARSARLNFSPDFRKEKPF